MRCTQLTKDISCEISNKSKIHELKEFFLKECGINGITTFNLRMFCCGQELLDSSYLAEYKVLEDIVITVFIRKSAQSGDHRS
jgi:hypothetical protein